MRRLPVAVAFAVASAFALEAAPSLAAPPAASAETKACVASSEKAQRLRIDGKLGDAQRELLVCARESCPSMVRSDCTVWLNEVNGLMPSIVVGAKDETGADIVDVRVFVDGQKLQSRLDGKSMPVPTGEHTVRLERDGAPPLEQKVLIREGEKARALSFQWKSATTTAAGAGAGGSSSGTAGSSGSGSGDGGGAVREHTLWPWLVVGVGVATAATGTIVYFVDRGDIPAACSFDSRSCASTASPGDQRAAEVATGRANAGLAVGIVGAVVAVGGLVWHFLEPTGPASSSSNDPSRSRSARSAGSHGLGSPLLSPVVAPSSAPDGRPGFVGATFSATF